MGYQSHYSSYSDLSFYISIPTQSPSAPWLRGKYIPVQALPYPRGADFGKIVLEESFHAIKISKAPLPPLCSEKEKSSQSPHLLRPSWDFWCELLELFRVKRGYLN